MSSSNYLTIELWITKKIFLAWKNLEISLEVLVIEDDKISRLVQFIAYSV